MSKSNYTINPKKLSELCRIKELQNENLTNNEEMSQKLLLRKTQRHDYSNPVSPGVKEKVMNGLNNGRWNNEEHRGFIEGIFKYSNDWKKITDDVKTRNCPQARSHSQKFFAKLNKYITKSNANYYVDLKQIFFYGNQILQEQKDAIVEMLIFAHDHLDNVLNCELLNHHILSDFLEIARKNKLPKERNLKLTSEGDGNRKFNKNKTKNQTKDEDELEESDYDCQKDHNKKQNFDRSEKNKESKTQNFHGSDYHILTDPNINFSGNKNIYAAENRFMNNYDEHNYLNVNSNKVNYNNNHISYFSNNAYVNLNLNSNNNANNGYTTNNTKSNYNCNRNDDNDNNNNNYNPIFNQSKYNYAKDNNKSNNYNEFFQDKESYQTKLTNDLLNHKEHEGVRGLNTLKALGIRANINQNFNKTFETLNNNYPEANNLSYFNLKKNSFTRETDSDDYDLNTRSGSFKKNSTKTDLQSLQQYTNSNSNGNFYENESQINFNNLNLTTLRDSTEEAKTKTHRRGESKNTEKASLRESSLNHDFVVPQPIKNNISNLIQINSEFARTFSQEIEKDNFFKKHSLEGKNSSSPPLNKSYSNALFNSDNKTSSNNTNNTNHINSFNYSNISNQTNENYNYDDNPMGKISAYDYNNFYFNRCLEYLKKNSHRGKTDLIQEIKKCFIFPKKLLIESNYCNCFKCIAENSDKTPEYNNDSYPERDKKCINNQFYYCEFDDISFISNHEKHCYMNNVKKDLNFDSHNLE